MPWALWLSTASAHRVRRINDSAMAARCVAWAVCCPQRWVVHVSRQDAGQAIVSAKALRPKTVDLLTRLSSHLISPTRSIVGPCSLLPVLLYRSCLWTCVLQQWLHRICPLLLFVSLFDNQNCLITSPLPRFRFRFRSRATEDSRQSTLQAMGDGRWAMGDGRWAMGDGRWAMGDERWGRSRARHVSRVLRLAQRLHEGQLSASDGGDHDLVCGSHDAQQGKVWAAASKAPASAQGCTISPPVVFWALAVPEHHSTERRVLAHASPVYCLCLASTSRLARQAGIAYSWYRLPY
ncbi:hypothetical protein EV126DRAFT_450007 [Verticillium dahliae]|nr:hypothetical protein EV126DRAFT_450007 [Verticillium dahliae]